MPVFYSNGVIYMLVRIQVNVSMTILPFYLEMVPFKCEQECSHTSSSLALVPLISYSW